MSLSLLQKRFQSVLTLLLLRAKQAIPIKSMLRDQVLRRLVLQSNGRHTLKSSQKELVREWLMLVLWILRDAKTRLRPQSPGSQMMFGIWSTQRSHQAFTPSMYSLLENQFLKVRLLLVSLQREDPWLMQQSYQSQLLALQRKLLWHQLPLL